MIFHSSKKKLESFKLIIGIFLRHHLALRLHPLKSTIFPLERGTEFLGFKVFPHHKRIKHKNFLKFKRKLQRCSESYNSGETKYDSIYEFMEGWIAYAKHANTFTLRQDILCNFDYAFSHEISTKQVNRARTKYT